MVINPVFDPVKDDEEAEIIKTLLDREDVDVGFGVHKGEYEIYHGGYLKGWIGFSGDAVEVRSLHNIRKKMSLYDPETVDQIQKFASSMAEEKGDDDAIRIYPLPKHNLGR
jgi:hypothetical protein